MIHPARVLASLLLGLVLGGCGSGTMGKKKQDFFTSGSREADQRASQRMAKAEQLGGGGEGSGEHGVKKARPSGGASADGTAARVETKLALFDRLGGERGLAAIVDDFLPRALQDPRVNWNRNGENRGGLFRRTPSPWSATEENVARLKKHLLQFLALATGGPPQYEGKEMKSTHAGMRITNSEFDAVVGDLKASLDKLQIPNKEQKELLAVVESTRPQIVTQR
jgi:hemoglobin